MRLHSGANIREGEDNAFDNVWSLRLRETRRQAVDDRKSQAGRSAAAGNAAAVFRVRSGCGTQGMGYKQL